MASTLSSHAWSTYRRTAARRRLRAARYRRPAAAVVAILLIGSCTTPRDAYRSSAEPIASAGRTAVARSAPPVAAISGEAELAALSNMSPESPPSSGSSPAPAVPAPWAGPAARPFVHAAGTATQRLRAHLCLATAIYYEADSESDDGERAVAQVVLNRVLHPAFPASVCGVVFQGSENPGHCQFSFACDGAMDRHRISAAGWGRASRIADAALAGAVFRPVGLAINYHTLAVAPRWSPLLVPAAVIGAHIFYRLEGPSGRPAACARHYAGLEPVPAPHPTTALAAAVAPIPPAAPLPTPPAFAFVLPAATVPAGFAVARAPITPDDQILPRWRDSGTWIAH